MAIMDVEVLDGEVVPSSLVSIAPFFVSQAKSSPITLASPISKLGRVYALKKAHELDPNSAESGVRQFQTGLLHSLEQDNTTTLPSPAMNTDASEIESCYRERYSQYIQALEQEQQARIQLGKAYQMTGVLFTKFAGNASDGVISPNFLHA